MSLKDNEMQEIEDLERMARRAPAGGDGAGMDLNGPLFVDGKEGVNVGVQFAPGKYALEVVNLELKMSKGGFDERTQTTKESIPYLELTFVCIAGEDPTMVGAEITDRLMAKGKGVTRFKIFAKAVGMWDDDSDQFNGRPIDFMGCQVWATIKDEKSVYQGQERIRSIVDFAGYEPIDKYPLPADDLEGAFDDEDHAVASPAVAPPVEEEDDEDLSAGQVEEAAEPAPAPERPAAASRPRARAAGQAGGAPPWK